MNCFKFVPGYSICRVFFTFCNVVSLILLLQFERLFILFIILPNNLFLNPTDELKNYLDLCQMTQSPDLNHRSFLICLCIHHQISFINIVSYF